MIVLWRKPFIQKFFRKMEWRWETQKKSEERELVKDKWYNQMGQVGTSWSRGTSGTKRGGSSDLSGTSGTRRRGSWDLRGTSGTRTRGLSTWTIPLVPNGTTRPWKIRWKEFCPFHENTGFTLTLLEKDPQNSNSDESSENRETFSRSKSSPATGVILFNGRERWKKNFKCSVRNKTSKLNFLVRDNISFVGAQAKVTPVAHGGRSCS